MGMATDAASTGIMKTGKPPWGAVGRKAAGSNRSQASRVRHTDEQRIRHVQRQYIESHRIFIILSARTAGVRSLADHPGLAYQARASAQTRCWKVRSRQREDGGQLRTQIRRGHELS